MQNNASVVSDIQLVIAYGTQIVERVRPLMEGDVKIDGCVARFVPLAPGEMLIRSFEDPEFNLAELSLSNYVTRTLKGDCPYIALPVHISRSFRHADIYIRTDRGIEKPGDLKGRKVGITEYQHTAHVWVRGMLADEYQIDPSELLWISGQLDKGSHPLDPHAFVPPSVHFERLDQNLTLSEALERGLIDAIVSPQAPSAFTKGAPSVGRLFSDTRAAEEVYYRKTGIFPILHVMGIRPALVRQYPGLAERLYKAFLAAKDIANARAASKAAPQISFLGNDLCPFGFDANTRKTLETFLRYHAEQGLSPTGTSIKTLYPSLDVDHEI